MDAVDICVTAIVGAIVCAVSFYCFGRYVTKANAHLPPHLGPTLFTNVAALTNIEGMQAVQHVYDISQTIVGFGRTSCGTVFRISMLGSGHFVVITDYKLARIVLEGNRDMGVLESEKTAIGRAFDLFLDIGSIFSNFTKNEDRRNSRKFIAPAFSMSNLKYTFDIVFQSLLSFENILCDVEKKGAQVDLNEAMIRLTFDTIMESAFGTNYHTLSQLVDDKTAPSDGSVYLQMSELRLKEGFKRALNPLRKYFLWSARASEFAQAGESMKGILERIIQTYIENHQDTTLQDNSIMGHLMRHEYTDPRQRVQDMNTFVLAGHETTSHTLTMMVICICQHTQVKQKLQAELDEAIQSAARHDRAKFPSVSELRSLPYLSMCINEAMRLFPTIGAGSKRCTLSDVHYEGIHIPKGSTCTLHYYSMFRPHWLDRRDEYLPERWAADAPHAQQLKDMLIPFASGSRNCIGQNLAKVELVMIAAYLLRFFDLELVGEPKFKIFLTMKATNARMAVRSRP